MNVYEAVQEGSCSVRVFGNGLSLMVLEITGKVSYPVSVTLGTRFKSQTGNVQDMVGTNSVSYREDVWRQAFFPVGDNCFSRS